MMVIDEERTFQNLDQSFLPSSVNLTVSPSPHTPATPSRPSAFQPSEAPVEMVLFLPTHLDVFLVFWLSVR